MLGNYTYHFLFEFLLLLFDLVREILYEGENVLNLVGNSLTHRPLPAFQCCTLAFQRATLKRWEWPGDEAKLVMYLLPTITACLAVS